MSADTDELRDLFVDVAGEETIIQHQTEEPSREPIEEHDTELAAEAAEVAREDGLADAVEGAEVDSEAFASG